MSDENPKDTPGDGVLLAFGNAAASSIVLGLFGWLVGALGPMRFYSLIYFAVFGFGVVQIPGVIFFALRNRAEPARLKGLIITSSILFLLNGGCWGLFAIQR